MDVEQKLRILADGAKYDVSCASSGGVRETIEGGIGNSYAPGVCHTFTSDGRCVSLLKVLFTNVCIFDCEYCINRASNNIKRASFTPRELADITINFYKRNYIEGLFLSSGIAKSPDHTMELMLKTVKILREEYKFNGYIHLKLIPGASKELIEEASKLADRVSSNIELPTEQSLKLLAPEKNKDNVLKPLMFLKNLRESSEKPVASTSTQLIVGATNEPDYQILRLASYFYEKKILKRMYYSAYIPVPNTKHIKVDKTPLLREHRLYQADWLLRFYDFKYEEIVEKDSNLDLELDPKTAYAIKNIHLYPIDVNKASYEELIRVPGIGRKNAMKIIQARAFKTLEYMDLIKLGISIKKAKHFIVAKKYLGYSLSPEYIRKAIIKESSQKPSYTQLRLW
ncbi:MULTISPECIES: putative DNA modification/repair radical SAM protein [unclassified Hydrogenobaculum]|uniref:putative DNA modification/repair radical SAM protein n=1 Tax=unclassified Hydrogenobaculum TaxID=2622382 RepID=UPI0001C529CB|nr:MULTISPECIES: putative DNA modification/repair radical SAM protein [unclassified Hydrogenobaculum]AEF18778.1 Elongator protein 3/MiaB/NifB [Hydrogenobaculum sp. 3684]AEG46066.1 Radical SAM domain protein [Hydrogenobaculum sp. SHO]AGG14710.1 Radical SAM domain protein [Hydrogenobaculum sp. HO]AGH93009.1 putative DNA modification/repair radical SAM protein [Hydrogenobaculum sp. SN]